MTSVETQINNTCKEGQSSYKTEGYFIYLFGVLCRFQHCTGHITTGSWKDRGNQYIQLVKVLYCKLPTNGKQLPAFPLEVRPGTEPRFQRWAVRVLPLCHRGPERKKEGYIFREKYDIKEDKKLLCIFKLGIFYKWPIINACEISK